MKASRIEIKGKKGVTVCYSIKDFNVNGADSSVTWNGFRFYTPDGDLTDSEGFKYFDVPAGSIDITRDTELDRVAFIVAELGNSRVLEILEGAEADSINLGLEGDVVAVVKIPSDPEEELTVMYKEVLDVN